MDKTDTTILPLPIEVQSISPWRRSTFTAVGNVT